jgi:hypothetical protein
MVERIIKHLKKVLSAIVGTDMRSRRPALAWTILLAALTALSGASVAYHLFFAYRDYPASNVDIEEIATPGGGEAQNTDAFKAYADTLDTRAKRFRELVGFEYGDEPDISEDTELKLLEL